MTTRRAQAELTVAGIDPGSRRTGFALATFDAGGRIVSVTLGAWAPPQRASRPEALASLRRDALAWLLETSPCAVAVESVFQHRNARSALVLAEARGALLSAVGEAGVPLSEYPPATIKKTVCGVGGARKEEVRLALGRSVPGLTREMLSGAPDDATDALAAAVCHRYHARFERAIRGSGR